MIQSPKLLFVYNPHAGKETIKSHLLEIIDIFTKAGYEVIAYPTQSRKDGERRVRERADDIELVVCSGGDGTCNEVVSGMLESNFQVPIGYVPAGSTNDFASSLKIPSSMIRAAGTIVDGRDFLCDVGRLNKRAFVYCAAFGVFTDISYSTNQTLKNALGHTAYLLQSVRELQEIRTYHAKITYGNGTVIEDEFIYGMITNSVQVGGIKGITGKNVSLDDGEFEVTLVRRPSNIIELPSIVSTMLGRTHLPPSPHLFNFKTSHVVIETEDEMPWTLDGEYGGSHTKADITVERKAFTIRVPK